MIQSPRGSYAAHNASGLRDERIGYRLGVALPADFHTDRAPLWMRVVFGLAVAALVCVIVMHIPSAVQVKP